MWQYNLSGSFDDVLLQFIGDPTILTIVDKFEIDRDAAVPESIYKGRIEENINATRAEITIFALKRSESGGYEIELLNSNRQRTRNRVTVQVQCKLTTKFVWIVSLLVLFVEKFWKHSVKVNLVSLLDISFHSFLTQTAAIFWVASICWQSSVRWSLNCYNKNSLAPIFSKYAARSRDLPQSYLETGSRPTFLNYAYLISTVKRAECDTLQLLEHCRRRTAYFRSMFVIIFFRDPWRLKLHLRNDFKASNIRKSIHWTFSKDMQCQNR